MVSAVTDLRQKLKVWEQTLTHVDGSAQGAEEILRTELLRNLLVACSMAGGLYIVLSLGGLLRTFLFPLGASDLLFAIGVSFWLLQRKQVALATVLLLVFLSHPIAFLIGAYGLESPAPALLLPTIVICGLLVGRKLVGPWTAICGGILLWDCLILREVGSKHLPQLVFWLGMYAAIGWLVALFSVHLERLLAAVSALEEGERATVVRERTRIARDLHDSLAQGFTGVIVQINAAEEAAKRKPDQMLDHLDRARGLARWSLEEARLSVWALRSSTDEDLPEQIERITERIVAGSGIVLKTSVEGQVGSLPAETQVHLLRIVQEAVSNAVRHSQACLIEITLRYGPDRIEIEIMDDGIGFPPEAPAGFGRIGMQERAALIAAKLDIHSESDGTTIRIRAKR